MQLVNIHKPAELTNKMELAVPWFIQESSDRPKDMQPLFVHNISWSEYNQYLFSYKCRTCKLSREAGRFPSVCLCKMFSQMHSWICTNFGPVANISDILFTKIL